MSPARVAVITLNWQRPVDTLECLGSILAGEQGNPEIIVVDNGSKDDSVQQISAAYPQIRLVQLPENQKFSGGFNAAIQAALDTECDLFLILNNDTFVEPGAIPTLAASGWDAAVPKIVYYAEPKRIWSAGCRWRRFPPSVAMNGFQQEDKAEYNQPRALDYATACALLVRREVLEATQGFDTDLDFAMEDYDFCYRIRQAGFTMGYVPQAVIRHKVSQSLAEYAPRRWQHIGKNTVLFYRKGRRFPLHWLWIFVLWVSLREAVKGHFRLLPGYWRGILEGFRALKAIDRRDST
jgi:hypothetical protein